MTEHNIEDTILQAINQMSMKLSLAIGFIFGSAKHILMSHSEDIFMSFCLGIVGALGGVAVKVLAHYISKWNEK